MTINHWSIDDLSNKYLMMDLKFVSLANAQASLCSNNVRSSNKFIQLSYFLNVNSSIVSCMYLLSK